MTDVSYLSDYIFMGLIVRIFCCIVAFSMWIYAAIDYQNQLTALRMAIPSLAREVARIEEANNRIRYDIERFENPSHLMTLARQPRFGHLRYPYSRDVVVINRTDEPQDSPEVIDAGS
ncbi:Uncharacterized protein SCG7086_AH_00220 [Chlamydiales bacterium SCGC AG-110-P3]|nr:Uncharacterized protein SCG7086_AH_00220 [Chlamydiales bacterium SCGC AG-110-P3]